jgi:putative phosphoesterase
MKILVMGDIHGQCQKIFNYLQKNNVDLIILTGDITHFGPSKLCEEILNEMCLFNAPTLVIPGNCDPTGTFGEIENSNAINIHNRTLIIKNIGICGFGGSNPTPFDTPLEFEEELIYNEIKKLMKQIENQEIRILVTHAPPYNTKTDLIPSGDHVGSKSIRRIVEEFQPSLNLCGHIHEAIAIDKIGNTTIVNPGESSQGFASIIDITEEDKGAKIYPKLINL